jgi:NAD(P)H-flavin reductase
MQLNNDPMLPRPFRLQQIYRETPDTFTMWLKPLDGSADFGFGPGQFNMVGLPGIGEVPVSVSGDSTQPEKLVHTLRAVGAVTQAVCHCRAGDVLSIRGPFGNCWPVEQLAGHDVVLLVGGLGLAPLRPVIYYILAHRAQLGKVVLLYGARTPQDLLYKAELEKWRGHFDLQVEITVDSPVKGWHGDVGVITTLVPRAVFNPDKVIALVCGPEIMMRFTMLELEKRQVTPEKIYVSMERNMECGIGLCGHCQLGPFFLCKNGPVFRFDQLRPWFGKREV